MDFKANENLSVDWPSRLNTVNFDYLIGTHNVLQYQLISVVCVLANFKYIADLFCQSASHTSQ